MVVGGVVLDECMHELTAAFCTICKSKVKGVAKREKDWAGAADGFRGGALVATFESDCGWCTDLIEVDDPVYMRMEKWVCEGCAEAFDEHPSNGGRDDKGREPGA